jgi:hypothetical protein
LHASVADRQAGRLFEEAILTCSPLLRSPPKGVTLSASLVGSISVVLEHQDSNSDAEFSRKKAQLEKYLQKHSIPRKLALTVHANLAEMWTTRREAATIAAGHDDNGDEDHDAATTSHDRHVGDANPGGRPQLLMGGKSGAGRGRGAAVERGRSFPVPSSLVGGKQGAGRDAVVFVDRRAQQSVIAELPIGLRADIAAECMAGAL